MIIDTQSSVFWRLLRPEYVKWRGEPPTTTGHLTLEEHKKKDLDGKEEGVNVEDVQLNEGNGGGEMEGELGLYEGFDNGGYESFIDQEEEEEEDHGEGEDTFDAGNSSSSPLENYCYSCLEEDDEEEEGDGGKENGDSKKEDTPKTQYWPEGTAPPSLSPDAFTAFSRPDPLALTHNKMVSEATDHLIEVIVPSLVPKIISMTPQELADLQVSTFLHSHGVNVRHVGLLRHHIFKRIDDQTCDKAEQVAIKLTCDKLLLEVIGRTLKNTLKDYQRRWMKAEQSTSEQVFFI